MLKHRASVHDDVRKFRCQYCDENFTQRGLCDAHVRSVHNKKQAKYFCEHCGLPFSKKVQLNGHYQTLHPESMAVQPGLPGVGRGAGPSEGTTTRRGQAGPSGVGRSPQGGAGPAGPGGASGQAGPSGPGRFMQEDSSG